MTRSESDGTYLSTSPPTSLSEAIRQDLEERDRDRTGWTSLGYTGEACPSCGRTRLERHASGRVTCDQCHWEPATGDYAEGKPTL